MKNLKTIFLLAAVALLFTGCVEDGVNRTTLNDTGVKEPFAPLENETGVEDSEGFAGENGRIQIPSIEVESVATDKQNYSSHEEMFITVTVITDIAVENASVKVWGIKPYNKAYIQGEEILDLDPGSNEIVFNDTTPYCTSGCGGVWPGEYEVVAEVYVAGILADTSSTTITLTKS